MTTSYPGAIDTLTNPTPSDPLNSATVPHASQHANANDAIEAIQNTLGTNPQGSDGTVKGRFIALEGAVLNLNNAIDERVPGETGSNQPVGARPDGYIWVDTTTHAIKVWNGTAYVDPSNAGGGGTAWAVASGGTESTITDGGKQYRLHRFNGNGTLTVSKAGFVEVLIVGAGCGGHPSAPGQGGDVVRGIFEVAAGPLAVTVGAFNSGAFLGEASALGTLRSSVQRLALGPDNAIGAGGSGTGQATYNLGLVSTITGASVTYATAMKNAATANTGDAGAVNVPGSSGVVLVRYQI